MIKHHDQKELRVEGIYVPEESMVTRRKHGGRNRSGELRALELDVGRTDEE